MTSERIAELRRETESIGVRSKEPAVIIRATWLKQLLDEREALLAAAAHLRDRVQLRPDYDWCRGDGDAPLPCGDAVALLEVTAAIAKAEAP